MNRKLGTKVVREVAGRVPHTVMLLASGRTFAHGRNPDPRPGNQPGAIVDSAIDALLGLEERARSSMGSVPSGDVAVVASTIRALRGQLDQYGELAGTGGSKVERESVLWGRVLLGHVAQLVATMSTKN